MFERVSSAGCSTPSRSKVRQVWKPGKKTPGVHTGNTNVWTLMSADPDLGYVYLPTGTPTNDWYGGHRKGDNLYAESLVCVDAATGKRIWHFQMVHHGLWDYDLPAAPNLVDIVVDGKAIKSRRAGVQTGISLCVRPAHGRTGLANRRAPSAAEPGSW